jgi:hypothetical protein
MKNRPDEVNKVISGSEIPPARRKTRLWPVDKNYRRQLRSAAWWNAQTGISSVLTCPIRPFLWVQQIPPSVPSRPHFPGPGL